MLYRLKLTKARSYRGCGVTATRESPVVEVKDAETAEALMKSGYFQLVESTQEETVEVKSEPDPDYDTMATMTKAELTAYANEHGIDVSKCRTKSDILTAISMACGGSPAMIDLQRDIQGGDKE